MKRVNVYGKTTPESYDFVDTLKWNCKSTISRMVGLAVDYVYKYHKDDFINFVKREIAHDKKGYFDKTQHRESEHIQDESGK